MKKLVQVQEIEGEGLEALLGMYVMVFALSYIYAGKLTGVNTDCILIEDAKIVYDTGAFTSKGYTDAQALPGGKVYVMKKNIEAFCEGK